MQWRVRNVMTTGVVTVRENAPVGEVAEVLTERRISAVPVVDRFDAVIGVVSWTDLINKIELEEHEGDARSGRVKRRRTRLRYPKATAADVMSAPPVTIGPDATLAAAGRAMYRRKVGRLLVVDGRERLAGVVTRTDLLKVHSRLDAVIRDEVTQVVLGRTLMVESGAVQVEADDGVVTLTGRTGRRSTALAAVALASAVEGVTAVVDRLAFDLDDTAPPPRPQARSQPPAPHGQHGLFADSRQ